MPKVEHIERTTTLDPDAVDELFENAEEQAEVLFGLYRMVFPEWDELQLIDGYPVVNDATGTKIMRRCIDFDRCNHPDVLSGGLWMNSGFGSVHDQGLDDWEVRIDLDVTFEEADE